MQSQKRAGRRIQAGGMADARQPLQVFFIECAQQVMQSFMTFPGCRACEVRAADAVRVPFRERQRPGGNAVRKLRMAETPQRDHRAAGEIVARWREALPEADQGVVGLARSGNPTEEGLRFAMVLPGIGQDLRD